jgi:NADPH:quinone reductase-like Zn-dependent oxidoreductase
MAIPIPENLSFEEAAALPEAFLTAREALFSLGRLRSGDVVLVHAAAGGVGSAAVQLAVQAGAHVVATAGSAEKLARVAELGAQTLVNYRVEDFARAVANTGRGASVVLDFVGGSYWEQHATCLADGGRCVVIGVLGGAKATVNLGQLLFKRLQILGLVMRSRSIEDKVAMTRSFVAETLPLFATGRLRPVIDSVYEMADVAKAHTRMEENANVGKVILRVG